jgi:predicted dehydrogenase
VGKAGSWEARRRIPIDGNSADFSAGWRARGRALPFAPMTTIRWGIIGTGMIAGIFARALPGARTAVKQAVGSRDAAKAKAFAKEHGFASAHGSYEALFADRDVDAVYISTPHTNHHAETLAALRAGKHVLVEKPMAVTTAQAEEMVAEARRAGRVLLEAFMYRVHPQTRRLQQELARGAIGEVRVVRSCFSFNLGAGRANVRFDRRLNGGALWDVGCYCVNASRMIGLGEPIAVQGVATLDAQTGVDAHPAAALRFPSGVHAHFDVGIQAANAAWLEVIGSAGRIHVPNPWKPNAQRTAFTVESAGRPADEIVIEDGGDIYAIEAEHLAEVVGGAASPIDGQAGIGNTRVLEALWRQLVP